MNLLGRISKRSIILVRTTQFRLARSFATNPAMDEFQVHNSLKPGGPVPFVPIQKGKVSWYACGPTVYDQSHLGHARNYVSTDIIRRILIHYFLLDVNFVMNITDVDDKIIIRARRQRLLYLEKQKGHTEERISELWKAAFQAYAKSNLPQLLDADGPELDVHNYTTRRDAAYGNVLAGGTLSGEGKPGDAEAKTKMHVNNMTAAVEAFNANQVLNGAEEILLPYLDSLYKETIDTSDHTIFTDLTKSMEDDFFNDMKSLNVLKPDVITRVTEYVEKIVDFVKQIVDKGFAYEAEGSVYFDIVAFEKAGNAYARLRPESRNDKSLQEEGEGSLSKSLGGKKSASDFALWKKSKKGEPSWPSPWGNGRPGWHIECSVMASDILGERMDIHSGGIDLAFPHHDNELAQSEAYYCQHGHEHTWVNNFLHMGHLSISGSKMSKSLKNFQTIKEALDSKSPSAYTARSMRIVFLFGRWNEGVEISPEMRTQASSWEDSVNNFFTNTKARLTEAEASANAVQDSIQNLSVSEKQSSIGLLAELEQTKDDFKAALINSFDTPRAMRVILEIIRKANIHMGETGANLQAIKEIARWITKMVGILGLDADAAPPYEGLGWAADTVTVDPAKAKNAYYTVISKVKALELPASDSITNLLSQTPEAAFDSLVRSGEKDNNTLAMPYLRATSNIRDELRRIANTLEDQRKEDLRKFCDQVRNQDLGEINAWLEDQRGNFPPLIKFIPAAKIKADLKAAEDKDAETAAEKAKQEQEEREKAMVPPHEMFKISEYRGLYRSYDSDGLPTENTNGSEVSQNQRKRLKKKQEQQKKRYEKYLAAQAAEA